MKSAPPLTWEICILAGGLSRRMGRDKSRLKLGRRTMLDQIRVPAESLGWPVRVIRRDAVARCGPLGGVYTALKTTSAEAVLFLACDMPFVASPLLRRVLRRFASGGRALFVRSQDTVGFPFALRRDALTVVAGQISRKEFSVNALARKLKAKTFCPPPRQRAQLRNINTPVEWERARRRWLPSDEIRPSQNL